MKDKKPKMTRKEREKQMIAEMESALWERKTDGEKSEPAEKESPKQKKEKPVKEPSPKAEQKLHCSRCGTLMENGKCPNCGHYIYMPMDKEKRNKIRWIVGGICVVAFAIIFVITQIKK